MTRVRIHEDCGNSPKNIFVQELTVAFAKGNSKVLIANTIGDIRWNVVGGQAIRCKDRFIEALGEKNTDPVLELVIHHIATHGKTGAVDGLLKFKSGKTRAFCDVYEFHNSKGTRVKEITS